MTRSITQAHRKIGTPSLDNLPRLDQEGESPPVGCEADSRQVDLDQGLWIQPSFHGYHAGQCVDALVFGLDGTRLGEERFCVGFSPGGGFAGQVVRAEPLRGIVWGRAGVDPHATVALKVLRPRSDLKTAFRDGLFRLCYQTPYPARLEENALRAGLIWQEILRQAVRVELGDQLSVARPLGYFWDAAIGSYVEVHQWADSRASIYEVDERLFLQDRTSQPGKNPPEMEQKRRAMERLVGLCQRIGAHGLARQYEWYTFVSQANVLTSNSPPGKPAKFVVVDCRPGLAVPFFLPLSPAHTRIIVQGLRRGTLVHFDQCDLEQLDTWLAAHPDLANGLQPLVDQLRIDNKRYRHGLPDLWQRRLHFWMDRRSQAEVRLARVKAWQRAGLLSSAYAARLRASGVLFWAALFLDNIPLLGSWLLRWWSNATFRQHLRALLRSSSYRRQVIEVQRQVDLEDWQAAECIPWQRAKRLTASLPGYLFEKVTLGWLPSGLHRLLVDPGARKRLLQERLLLPLDLSFREQTRRAWLCAVIEGQHAKGLVGRQKADELCAQSGEPRLRSFLQDLGFSLGLEIFSKLAYLGLGIYGLYSGDFWPLGLALLGPVPPSGVARCLYGLIQLCLNFPGILRRRDRRELAARSLGIAVAPWRFVGNLFAPLEMLFYYRRLSLLLANHFVTQMVRGIPVFGGEGKLLEYWAFQVTFNFPLRLYRRFVGKIRWA
jgi:hypothetical protein